MTANLTQEQASNRRTTEEEGVFTPLFERVLQDLGRSAASVYGRVWRYCQGPQGVCYASVRSIATEIGWGKTVVNADLKRLVEHGYLEDLTPGLRFVPHHYKIASGNRQSVRQTDNVRQTDRVSAQRTGAPKSVPQAVLKIEDIKERTKRELTPPPSAELGLFRAAAEFNPPRQVVDEVIDAIRKVGQRLGREPTADDLRPFLKAWVSRGFRLNNLAWLFDWAVSGTIPERSERSERSEWKKGADGNHVQGHPGNAGRPAEPTPEQLAAYAEVNARRRAAIAALHDVR